MDDPTGGRPLSDVRSGRRAEDRLRNVVPPGLDATLVLLRHGESTAIVEGRFQGQLDVPLSPVGRRQAALAAARLAQPQATPALPVPSGPPIEIVHSPLARATETATVVAAAVSADDAFDAAIPLRADAGFAEIAQGAWEGRLATEIVERWSDLLEAWHAHPTEAWAPGGESLAQVDARVLPSLRTLLAALAASDAEPAAQTSPLVGRGHLPTGPWSIIVGHDGVFKVVLLTLLELPLDRFWTFPFALCGISVVELVGGRPRLRAHNLTEHLAPLLDERAQEVSEERERLGAL